MSRFKCDGEKVLLTEGSNDCHVIANLCQRKKLPHLFGLHQCDSDDKVLKAIRARINGSVPVKVIGAVLDADTSLLKRWRSVKNLLQKEGYTVPEEPGKNGTILVADNLPRIGIWLMPSGSKIYEVSSYVSKFILKIRYAGSK